MKNKISKTIKLLTILLFIGGIYSTAWSQSVTPVITAIGNSGPACTDGSITLNATGTVGGVSSSFIRMAGIGGNYGNQAFTAVFSSGDRAGSIERISMGQFDAIFSSQTTNANRAAALKAKYDVLMFTWASPIDYNINWGLITAYLETGGSVFVDGDGGNITRFYDGTPNSVKGFGSGTTGGCNYTLVSPAPFPTLVANGVNGCFANDHLYVESYPSWMEAYIVARGRNLAVAGVYPNGNQGRLIVQGPDQDYHARRGGSATQANQYQIMLNQMDFLTANQAGFTWTGPNGFTSNEANPVIPNVTAASAGVYTATLTNTNGGASTSATTTVVVNVADIPEISVSGATNLCPGDTVTLTASTGGSYLWSNGATTQSIVVDSQDNYTVKVAGSNGCVGESLATIVNVDNSYCNQPPVAKVKNITVNVDENCSVSISSNDINDGSSDPDGDVITYSLSSNGPFTVGIHNVTMTVTDPSNESDSATATVTVEDNIAPVVLTKNITVELDENGDATITPEDIQKESVWIAYINVYDLPENGGGFFTGEVTDLNSLQSDVNPEAGTITLKPNFSKYVAGDPVWSNGNIGNKIIQSSTYVEETALVGQSFTFTGNVISNTLDPSYQNYAFVRIFTASFSLLEETRYPLVQGDDFSVQYNNTQPGAVYVQYGFTIQGLNANPANEATLGNVVVNATSSLTDSCGESFAIDKASFSCANVGENIVTLIGTDVNGNEATTTAIVTIVDATAPTVITKTYSIDLTNGVADITPSNIDGGTFDNCDFTLSIDKDHFTCDDIGDHVVTLTATDASNNTTSSTAIISVLGDVPTIAINDFNAVQTQKKNTIFLGFADTVNLTTMVSGGSGFTYEWTTSSGELVSNEANPSISPEVSTTYDVTVTNSNGCTASTSMYVCVIDARAFDKKGKYKGKVTVCHHTNGKKGTKHVQINISSDAVMTHLTKHGIGTDHADSLGACNAVCVDNTNARSTSKTSFTTTSIEDNLSIYPNPSNGIFDIKLTSGNLQTELFLFDTTGKLIERTSISKENSAENIITMGNHNLASGIYLLKIINKEETIIKKLIIEKSN